MAFDPSSPSNFVLFHSSAKTLSCLIVEAPPILSVFYVVRTHKRTRGYSPKRTQGSSFTKEEHEPMIYQTCIKKVTRSSFSLAIKKRSSFSTSQSECLFPPASIPWKINFLRVPPIPHLATYLGSMQLHKLYNC